MTPSQIEDFIARWTDAEGGQERANYALFLSELCDVIGAPRPDPAGASSDFNDYVFERAVKDPLDDGAVAHRRIDLYKRGCFVLEAKQSRLIPGGRKTLPDSEDLFRQPQPQPRGRRSAARSWDTLMLNAKAQAERYARCLPAAHGWPPFILVCDVGHVIEVYADFTGQGKNYAQFPDRQGFRIYLEDLRDDAVRARLRAIWTDPQSLDPTKRAARVTREIAQRLAAVSKALEQDQHPSEQVAMFLMRCLFTMFAEDVELLPKGSFRDVLQRCETDPGKFPPMVEQLWTAMDEGSFAYALEAQVRRFNGEFFKDRTVLRLGRAEISELRAAAEADWREVEPAIFGALLEQALDPTERRQLGAHYTPRAYVERLVVATVIEPLRDDWREILATVEKLIGQGDRNKAITVVKKFHDVLCNTRVLDPACGTGNFLYVALELMKRMEGEVLDVLSALGGQEAFATLEGHTVDPHLFLGLEVNPRAAAIAELVLWIGYLQWHFRTKGAPPSDPILRAFKNIVKRDAVLEWDGYPVPKVVAGEETYPHPRLPDWPTAEFIVGNPPFIGGKDIRARLGAGYAEALWAAHPKMNDSADYVMYWWDRAADILTRSKTKLRRFGFVTTNSISQVFQRKTLERWLSAKKPLSLVMAIPDHPWTKLAKDSAAVRIAMTVAQKGRHDGLLRAVIGQAKLETDEPEIDLADTKGRINADLTIGVDLAQCAPLKANYGLCSRGVSLHGAGFIVTPQEAQALGLGRRPGLEQHIHPYRNGRDLAARPRGVMVIDLFGLTIDDVRARFPEVYQHLALRVKPERDLNNRISYRDKWWVFGEPRSEIRKALSRTKRYIATSETSRHRFFAFIDSNILADNMIVEVALEEPYFIGVLSSSTHTAWSRSAGGWLGVGNDCRYSKTRTFDPFPFPAATQAQQQRIGAIAEELDAHRKRVLAEHGHLTMTGLYNVLERLKSGVAPQALDQKERRIFDDGLVLILKELHDQLDVAVADAYGWPVDLSEQELLGRLVALNRERAAEEARGQVRWLRPDYQIPRFGAPDEQARQIEADLETAAAEQKPSYPSGDDVAETAAVMAALIAAPADGLTCTELAQGFKQGRRIEAKIAAVLAALRRMGHVEAVADTWRLRRAG